MPRIEAGDEPVKSMVILPPLMVSLELDEDRRFIAIERHLIGPLAFGQRADRLARRLHRLREDVLGELVDVA